MSRRTRTDHSEKCPVNGHHPPFPFLYRMVGMNADIAITDNAVSLLFDVILPNGKVNVLVPNGKQNVFVPCIRSSGGDNRDKYV